MKKFVYYILLLVGFAGFVKLMNNIAINSNEKLVIRDIKSNFEGVVIKKVAKRKDLFLDVRLKRAKKLDTIVDVSSFHDKINVGDILIKKTNYPYCFVIDGNAKRKYPFTLIPKKLINNKDFPPEWRDSCKAGWRPLLVD